MKYPRTPLLQVLLLTGWLVIGLGVPNALADDVVLKSGGRIEGEITEANDRQVVIKVENFGEIRFDREDVDHIEYRRIRRLPTVTPPRPPATLTPTSTPTRRFILEPTVVFTTPTNTPKLSLEVSVARPTKTPATIPTKAERQPVQPERETVEPEPEWPPTEPKDEEIAFEDLFAEYDEEDYAGGFSWDPREFDQEALEKQLETFAKGFQLLMALVALLFYAYLSLCRHVIAVKTETPNAWWAWIPVLRDLLLLKVGDNPAWFAVFLYLGLGIQLVVSTMFDIPYATGFFERLLYSLADLIGFMIWGLTSYVMWRDVCPARGKAQSTAYLMHLHVVFALGAWACCCFFPFVLVGVIFYYIIGPAFLAFYK